MSADESESQRTSLQPVEAGFLRKALSEDRSAVLIAADLTYVLQTILKQLNAFPASLNLLGQACLGAVLIQALSDTDENEKVEIQWQSAGPFGNLYADALGTGKIRGTIQNLRAEVESLHVSLGSGLLQVRKVNSSDVQSTGITQASGIVADDLKIFLEQSEQKTCDIHLHVGFEIQQNAATGLEELLISEAYGFLIHILPTDTEEIKQKMIDLWQHRIQMLGPLREWMLPRDPQAATRTMIEWLTVGSKPQLLKKFPVEYYCTCSIDRVQRALGLLTNREKTWIMNEDSEEGIADKNSIEVNCEFCGKSYKISKQDVQ